MAENIVVKEQLTDVMIEDGARLTARLIELGVPIAVALWLFDPERAGWELILVSPEVATKGPLGLYGTIRNSIDELGIRTTGVPPFSVRLMAEHENLPRRLRATLTTGPDLERIRLYHTTADGYYIEDAVVYRVTPPESDNAPIAVGKP